MITIVITSEKPTLKLEFSDFYKQRSIKTIRTITAVMLLKVLWTKNCINHHTEED